jgi:hypothetical protein
MAAKGYKNKASSYKNAETKETTVEYTVKSPVVFYD